MVTESGVQDLIEAETALGSVEECVEIQAGSNQLFAVTTVEVDYVVKFNTWSQYETFTAELHVLQYLQSHPLRVPDVVAAEVSPQTGPAWFIMKRVPGKTPPPLREQYTPHLAPQVGFAILQFEMLDATTVEGYGRIHASDRSNHIVAQSESWREYYRRYVRGVLADAEESAPPELHSYIPAIREALGSRLPSVPETPAQSLVVPDFRVDNLLVENEVVRTVLDFERADIGDSAWTFVNTHYLLTRGLSPEYTTDVWTGMYDGYYQTIPEACIEAYRLGAIAKEIRAFERWWEGVSEKDYNLHLERVRSSVSTLLSGC